MKRVFRLASILIITLMFVGCFNTVEPLKHTLIVSIQGEGFVDPTPGTYQFDKETLINISATASDDWVFSHWIGPVADTTANETTVLVEQETSVIAVFAQNSLTIQTGPGGLITRRIDGSRPASRSEKDIQYITIHAMSDALENPTNPYNMNRIRYILINTR